MATDKPNESNPNKQPAPAVPPNQPGAVPPNQPGGPMDPATFPANMPPQPPPPTETGTGKPAKTS